MFRPCIDLHEGRVKQIVGATLSAGAAALVTNFSTGRSSAWFADLYRRDGLSGGHLIMLGPGNVPAAKLALRAFPGGLQVGGGISPLNAREFLDAGASHVIVTSWIFENGRLLEDRLSSLSKLIGKKRLVIDLSARKHAGAYYVATDGWRRLTSVDLSRSTLSWLARYCAEFLVHAVELEGRLAGVDLPLVELLGRLSPLPVTYAGGVRSAEDIEEVYSTGRGRVDVSVGSALDIFGGPLKYQDVVALCHSRDNRPG